MHSVCSRSRMTNGFRCCKATECTVLGANPPSELIDPVARFVNSIQKKRPRSSRTGAFYGLRRRRWVSHAWVSPCAASTCRRSLRGRHLRRASIVFVHRITSFVRRTLNGRTQPAQPPGRPEPVEAAASRAECHRRSFVNWWEMSTSGWPGRSSDRTSSQRTHCDAVP